MGRVSKGDPLRIPHDVWNALLDMLSWWRRGHRNDLDSEALSSMLERSQTLAWVKNASGGSRQRYEILGLETTLIDPSYSAYTDDTLAFSGITPTTAAHHSGKFCVLQEPIANNAIGLACIDGVTLAKLSVGSTSHTHAEVTNNDGSFLTTGAIGCVRVLYNGGGTGTKTGMVKLGHAVGEILIKNDTGSDIAINSSGTYKVFSGTPGSETDTGQTISAYNKSSTAFKNGKFGSASLLSGQAYAVPWQT